MAFPADLKYTKDHEWVRLDGDMATVGITDFAQGELGDIVFVEIDTVGKAMEAQSVFGTVEAVKTVSDLMLPLAGTITEVNSALSDNPELVNQDPYQGGWMIKMKVNDPAGAAGLLDAAAYQKLIGD